MKIIDEIVDLLSSDDANLTNALFKTKVLAFRFGQSEIADWVTKELEGYSDSSEVPSYRTASQSVYGSVSNGYYHYEKVQLPIHHLPAKLKESFETAKFRQSISALEEFARKNRELTSSVPTELNSCFSEKLSDGYYVQQAWGVVSVGAPKEIVTRVRTRLLDFILELSEKLPNDLPEDEMKEEAKKNNVRDLFNRTVIGDNATFVFGDNNSLTLKNSVKKGDFDSLAREMAEHKVDFSDIEKLKAAIKDDESVVDIENSQLGENVENWISKVSKKAADTSLAATAGAIGNLLAKAISNYYGF